MPASLGFLLALPPEDDRTSLALAFLEGQRRLPLPPIIYAYCLADGVRNLTEPPLRQLQREGIRVLACAQSARQRGIAPGVQAAFGGLGMLHDLLAGTDTFIAVGPGSPADWAPPQHRLSPPSGPGTREIVITLLDENTDSRRATEAVRVAAGLRAAGDLGVILAVAQPAFAAWIALTQVDMDPITSEHLLLFRNSGGRVVIPAPSVRTPLGTRMESAWPGLEPLPGPAWDALLVQAFALIPF